MSGPRRLEWDRGSVIDDVAKDIWKYLTPNVKSETQHLLEAAALLQMPYEELLTFARVHFLLSKEVKAFVDALPQLVRRLSNTTANEEERSSERIRGAIRWSSTISARLASGNPIEYVTAPARRAYQTAENELLVLVLDSIIGLARASGWNRHAHVSEAGVQIAHVVAEAERWSAHRPFPDVDRRPVTPRTVTRVRTGRHKRNYRPALDAYLHFQDMVARLDRQTIKSVVEQHALVVVRDPVLFELLTFFKVLDALRHQGWAIDPLNIVKGSVHVDARRDKEFIRLYYQDVPRSLATAASPYRVIQRHHGMINTKPLIPDLLIKHQRDDGSSRWWLLECKMGIKRDADASARVALRDLFAYRRAFAPVLDTSSEEAYGLGVVWGEGMEPRFGHEALLCTIDKIAVGTDLMFPRKDLDAEEPVKAPFSQI